MQSIRSIINFSSDVALKSLLSGGVGYLAARAFTSINPIHGGVFCSVVSLVSKVITPLFERAFSGYGANQSSRVLGGLLGIATVIGISSLITTGIGFTMPYTSALYLVALSVGTFVLIQLGNAAVVTAIEAARRRLT